MAILVWTGTQTFLFTTGNSILDLQTEHLFAPSQGSSSQPLVILIVAAAVVTNVFSPASWSSALFSSQGLPIGC